MMADFICENLQHQESADNILTIGLFKEEILTCHVRKSTGILSIVV